MKNMGQIVAFEIFKGKPRVVRGTVGSPNCKVGICTCARSELKAYPSGESYSYTGTDRILLVQEDDKWMMWHRLDGIKSVTIDELVDEPRGGARPIFYDEGRERQVINSNLRQRNRSAGWYPSLAAPDDKCSKCGDKAFWAQWCYTTVSGKTNGRIVCLCKECTMNGEEEHSNLAHCKLSGDRGTDRLLYEYDGEGQYGWGNLYIKLRINSKNLPNIDKIPALYHRWSELRDDQVIILSD
jgi:hypothetical protein